MLNRATETHRLGPTLAWSFGGSAVVLALAVVLYVLVVWLGAWATGTAVLPRLAAAPMYREFTGLFLASALGIYLAREFSVRSR